MGYEDPNSDDEVPASRRSGGAAPGPGCVARVLVGQEPEGLHPAPTVRGPGPEDVLQDRLPGHRPAPCRLLGPPRRPVTDQGPALLHTLLRGLSAAKKGEVVVLL